MTKLAEKLARTDINQLSPYQSARRELMMSEDSGKTWLNANESGGNDNYMITGTCINRYPDFQPAKLLDAYRDYCTSQYATIRPEQLLATRGADEGIDVLIRTFCQAGKDSILICPPTYGMYAISAKTQGASVVEVPLTSEYQLNVDAIIKEKGQVKLVFLCSPNNPTGNLLDKNDIETVINAFADSALVVVDEAYIEFCPQQSVADWLDQYPNLVILRTLSKAFALAGLRCGFTLASPSIITMLSKVIAPYPIAEPVAELASKSLTKSAIDVMVSRVTKANRIKQELAEWLEQWSDENAKLSGEILVSDANFILIRNAMSQPLFLYLKDQGILVRDQSKQRSLHNCLRFSIGNEQEISKLKQALNEFSAELMTNIAEETQA